MNPHPSLCLSLSLIAIHGYCNIQNASIHFKKEGSTATFQHPIIITVPCERIRVRYFNDIHTRNTSFFSFSPPPPPHPHIVCAMAINIVVIALQGVSDYRRCRITPKHWGVGIKTETFVGVTSMKFYEEKCIWARLSSRIFHEHVDDSATVDWLQVQKARLKARQSKWKVPDVSL